ERPARSPRAAVPPPRRARGAGGTNGTDVPTLPAPGVCRVTPQRQVSRTTGVLRGAPPYLLRGLMSRPGGLSPLGGDHLRPRWTALASRDQAASRTGSRSGVAGGGGDDPADRPTDPLGGLLRVGLAGVEPGDD